MSAHRKSVDPHHLVGSHIIGFKTLAEKPSKRVISHLFMRGLPLLTQHRPRLCPSHVRHDYASIFLGASHCAMLWFEREHYYYHCPSMIVAYVKSR